MLPCGRAAQATLFGPQDGHGVSIVFYFRLPDDFDPAKFENQPALALFKRFVANGREADGTPTRDRCARPAASAGRHHLAQAPPGRLHTSRGGAAGLCACSSD